VNKVKCGNVNGDGLQCAFVHLKPSNAKWRCPMLGKWVNVDLDTTCVSASLREGRLCVQLGITPGQLQKIREEATS